MKRDWGGGQILPGLTDLHYQAYVQEQQRKAAQRELVVILPKDQWEAIQRIKASQSLGEG